MKKGRQRPDSGPRQLLILDELQKGSNVSQRALAQRLGVAVGVINRHVHDLIEAGYIKVANRAVRPFAYRLTNSGRRYHRRLSHEHYSWVLTNLRAIERRISSRLGELKKRGMTRVVFYGAGDVMEATHRLSQTVGLQVAGVVDDDPTKQGRAANGLLVRAPSAINRLEPQAVIITTFRHAPEIRGKIDPSLRSSIQVWEL